MQEELIKYLSGFVTERRWQLFSEILEKRTRYITVVLEDIFQPHNASAVLRSCDCFGIQDVHIIENLNEYKVNPDVALGSNKWLDLYKYNDRQDNTLAAYKALRDKGYRIIATTPGDSSGSLDDFDFRSSKAAFVFGTELKGLTEKSIAEADEHLHIPMQGFTESLNISVSAAITLYDLTKRLRDSDLDWQLSKAEMSELKLKWLRNSIKSSELLEKEFLASYNDKDMA